MTGVLQKTSKNFKRIRVDWSTWETSVSLLSVQAVIDLSMSSVEAPVLPYCKAAWSLSHCVWCSIIFIQPALCAYYRCARLGCNGPAKPPLDYNYYFNKKKLTCFLTKTIIFHGIPYDSINLALNKTFFDPPGWFSNASICLQSALVCMLYLHMLGAYISLYTISNQWKAL